MTEKTVYFELTSPEGSSRMNIPGQMNRQIIVPGHTDVCLQNRRFQGRWTGQP